MHAPSRVHAEGRARFAIEPVHTVRATECELELGDTGRSSQSDSQSEMYAVIFAKFAGRVHVMY
jgi:hypothetical protein